MYSGYTLVLSKITYSLCFWCPEFATPVTQWRNFHGTSHSTCRSCHSISNSFSTPSSTMRNQYALVLVFGKTWPTRNLIGDWIKVSSLSGLSLLRLSRALTPRNILLAKLFLTISASCATRMILEGACCYWKTEMRKQALVDATQSSVLTRKKKKPSRVRLQKQILIFQAENMAHEQEKRERLVGRRVILLWRKGAQSARTTAKKACVSHAADRASASITA